jgi:hypothetical protein
MPSSRRFRNVSDGFAVKDSGERREFASGMVRDTSEGKINFLLVRPGPMLRRWAAHLTKAAAKYDTERQPGEPRNWTLASGEAELERFQESAARHFEQWLAGEIDEDHAAAIYFNVNGAELVKERLAQDPLATDEELAAVAERIRTER